MTRKKFLRHTEDSLHDAVEWASDNLGKALQMPYCVRWLGDNDSAPVCSGIADHIASRVWEGPDRIRPCVDLVVSELLDDGRLLTEVYVAGYEATEFGRNWSGRQGPYVFACGEKLKNQLAA